MKITKFTVVALILAVSPFAYAKKEIKPISKEDYIASVKAAVEKKGGSFDMKKTTARFNRIDTDKDGIASVEERKAFAAKRKKGKK